MTKLFIAGFAGGNSRELSYKKTLSLSYAMPHPVSHTAYTVQSSSKHATQLRDWSLATCDLWLATYDLRLDKSTESHLMYVAQATGSNSLSNRHLFISQVYQSSSLADHCCLRLPEAAAAAPPVARARASHCLALSVTSSTGRAARLRRRSFYCYCSSQEYFKQNHQRFIAQK